MNQISAYFNPIFFTPEAIVRTETCYLICCILLRMKHIHPQDFLGIVYFDKVYLGRLEVMVSHFGNDLQKDPILTGMSVWSKDSAF